jgi:hypothetical protein
VGDCAARASRRHAATPSWVLASTLIVIALRLSEIARAPGATRAVMHPRATRAHRSRSRFEPVLDRSRNHQF